MAKNKLNVDLEVTGASKSANEIKKFTNTVQKESQKSKKALDSIGNESDAAKKLREDFKKAFGEMDESLDRSKKKLEDMSKGGSKLSQNIGMSYKKFIAMAGAATAFLELSRRISRVYVEWLKSLDESIRKQQELSDVANSFFADRETAEEQSYERLNRYYRRLQQLGMQNEGTPISQTNFAQDAVAGTSNLFTDVTVAARNLANAFDRVYANMQKYSGTIQKIINVMKLSIPGAVYEYNKAALGYLSGPAGSDNNLKNLPKVTQEQSQVLKNLDVTIQKLAKNVASVNNQTSANQLASAIRMQVNYMNQLLQSSRERSADAPSATTQRAIDIYQTVAAMLKDLEGAGLNVIGEDSRTNLETALQNHVFEVNKAIEQATDFEFLGDTLFTNLRVALQKLESDLMYSASDAVKGIAATQKEIDKVKRWSEMHPEIAGEASDRIKELQERIAKLTEQANQANAALPQVQAINAEYEAFAHQINNAANFKQAAADWKLLDDAMSEIKPRYANAFAEYAGKVEDLNDVMQKQNTALQRRIAAGLDAAKAEEYAAGIMAHSADARIEAEKRYQNEVSRMQDSAIRDIESFFNEFQLMSGIKSLASPVAFNNLNQQRLKQGKLSFDQMSEAAQKAGKALGSQWEDTIDAGKRYRLQLKEIQLAYATNNLSFRQFAMALDSVKAATSSQPLEFNRVSDPASVYNTIQDSLTKNGHQTRLERLNEMQIRAVNRQTNELLAELRRPKVATAAP